MQSRPADYCWTDGPPHQILSTGFSTYPAPKLKPTVVLLFWNLLLFKHFFPSTSELAGDPYPSVALQTLFLILFESHRST